jgi:hypothetical protein
MKHTILAAVAAAGLTGCQMPPEQINVQPVPVDGPLPYHDLLTRARGQATTATEAFYVDNWASLEDAAVSLERTATMLPKAAEVPAERKASLEGDATRLGDEARKLREAAKAADVKKSIEYLQRIHLQVRSLQTAKPNP